MFDKLILYYFTGTVNAVAAANCINDSAEINNIPVDIKKITPALKVNAKGISKNTLIGFYNIMRYCFFFKLVNDNYFIYKISFLEKLCCTKKVSCQT